MADKPIKALAYWSKICPGCNIGRKYPNSFIGVRVKKHWEQGCPVNEAYQFYFGTGASKSRGDKSEGK